MKKEEKLLLRSAATACAAGRRASLAALGAALQKPDQHQNSRETNDDVNAANSIGPCTKKLHDEIKLERSDETPVERADDNKDLGDETEIATLA